MICRTIFSSRIPAVLLLLGVTAFTPSIGQAENWTAPTPEELSMTSQPETPGAPAVYLFREELTQDDLHMWSVYVRMKVLTEDGKKYGDVRLYFNRGHQSSEDYNVYRSDNLTIGEISGRTIHPDGTILPFTGKPYEKKVEDNRHATQMMKVFSLPDVQVGSILEYRYTMRWDDTYYVSPDWFPQQELYVRKAHYVWKPTDRQLVVHQNGRDSYTTHVAWSPVLPPNATVKNTEVANHSTIELNISDVKPLPQEEFMPPLAASTYRVNFYYTTYSKIDDFWKDEGSAWSKQTDKQIGPGSKVKEFVSRTISPSDSNDVKLHKLYAAVMALDNTLYSHSHNALEQKLTKKEVKNSDDVLVQGAGNDDQLALLFVSMARAAGFKAYAMRVVDREQRLFQMQYLSLNQLDDFIAIVNVDGKDIFFDPGERYCPFGHLEWRHTDVQGVRQTDKGTQIVVTPDETYSFSRTERIGDLTMADDGQLNGTVTFSFFGEPAIGWRHVALRQDDAGLQDQLKKSLEGMLPSSMTVEVTKVANQVDYEEPFKVSYRISGPAGKVTSTRLILPADLFLINETPAFSQEKRELGVYFHYPEVIKDAVRIKYPASLTIESFPTADLQKYKDIIEYDRSSKESTNSITYFRNLYMGTFFFKRDEYPELRSFYGKFQKEDHDVLVFHAASSASAPPQASAKPGN